MLNKLSKIATIIKNAVGDIKQEVQRAEEKEPTQKQERAKKRYLTTAQRIQKGKDYEFYLKNHFQNLDYKVFPNGYVKGVKDGGIDLLAYKDKEMLLIQCKNWKNSPKQKDLKAFVVDCENYIKSNQANIKEKSLRMLFVTSCKDMDNGVKFFIDEYNSKNDIKIEYEIIQMS